MARSVEFGLNTFGAVSVDESGASIGHAQSLRNVVEQAVRADELGIDVIGLGEHHRDDFAISAPEVVLAAIAARTGRIRLASAVTVLSSDDPVRVFQRFATVDALSGGRAEVIMGRGSFTESFPLFGYELADYERLFEEKLQLWAEVVKEGPVTWSGTVRAPLDGQHIYPKTGRPAGEPIPTWVGVGGSPESVIRTARHGFGLMLAVIGGEPSRFAPFAGLFKRALREFGQPARPVGVHSPGHIAATDAQAREELWPHYYEQMSRIGAERGWPPPSRAQFESEADAGALFAGSPETVAARIAQTIRDLDLDRFDLKYETGRMPHSQLMSSIELYGTEVIPRVRELLDESDRRR
ncbi:LLM class flavin-dependent oxidoreductase [Sediminivirga luteola]|uniref:Oxidoreductase n=1 Tax=Sediminivirga luteola TaxID=1774748 RepID=A0A8J2TXK9_9MICO|nr:LLM class flavin-dependent oxidoreductase [Sediminivirga luteola]MCI2266283.1 LLM class flavin-dependent oxidoreductase [Sediminivirga luteola]GGA12337.1 oxidoreductase [Sediminivirga luteola]